MKMKKIMILVIVAALLLTVQCGKNYDVYIKNLPPRQKEFISTARYLISETEKKAFFALPDDSARDAFIDNFWARRDTDPGTEENEFKIDYYKRIDEANMLFKGENKAGWLTDRGRVLVILGIPDFRRFNPGAIGSGADSRQWYQYPHEIWYYGLYPIYFVDRLENGVLELVPSSSQFVSTLIQTTRQLNAPHGKIPKSPFNFALMLDKKTAESVHFKVRIPIKNLLFNQEKDQFVVRLDFHFIITDSSEAEVHKSSSQHVISITEEELKKFDESGDYFIDFPIPARLAPGEYNLLCVLESKTDQVKTQQKIKFQI